MAAAPPDLMAVCRSNLDRLLRLGQALRHVGRFADHPVEFAAMIQTVQAAAYDLLPWLDQGFSLLSAVGPNGISLADVQLLKATCAFGRALLHHEPSGVLTSRFFAELALATAAVDQGNKAEVTACPQPSKA